MKDKISIIIPVYNCADYIERCLYSIINQTFSNIEAICINDGSTDNSLEVLNKIQKKDSRIIIINQENQGVSIARNNGINQASGNYIMFVDADDYLQNNACEILINAAKKYNTDLVRANYQRVYENGETIVNKKINCTTEKMFDKNEITNYIIPKLINGDMRTYLWLLLVKKEFIKKNNIRFIKDIKMMQDKLFYFNMFTKLNNMIQIDDIVYNYYCNTNSTIMSMNKCAMRCDYILIVLRLVIDILIEANLFTNKNKQNLLNNHFNMICRELTYAYSNNPKNLRPLLKKLKENNDFKNLIVNINPKLLNKNKRILFHLLKNEYYKLSELYIITYSRIKKMVKKHG